MKTAAAIAATLFASTALAADDAALAQCAAVSVDAARLACYDALAGRPAASPGAAPEASAGALAPAAAPPAPSEADFGKPPAPRVEPDSIRARIVGATRELKPGVILKLDNGQVWKVSTETGSSYRGIPDDAEVVITKGWLGSYWMEVIAIKRQFKVRRVS